jgi:hypothetical protein
MAVQQQNTCWDFVETLGTLSYTRPCHWSLSCPTWIPFTLSYNISYHLCLGHPHRLRPPGFATQIVCFSYLPIQAIFSLIRKPKVVLYDELEWHLFYSGRILKENIRCLAFWWACFEVSKHSWENNHPRLTLYWGHHCPLNTSHVICDSTRVTGLSPDTNARTETTAN